MLVVIFNIFGFFGGSGFFGVDVWGGNVWVFDEFVKLEFLKVMILILNDFGWGFFFS